MKTGTDISIAECRTSGYAVVEHGKSPMDPDKAYPLTISFPPHWTDSGRPMFGFPRRDLYTVDTLISYSDLWETFERQGQGIKDFCDFKNCPFPSPQESPTFSDFVNLAQTIDPYCGIE